MGQKFTISVPWLFCLVPCWGAPNAAQIKLVPSHPRLSHETNERDEITLSCSVFGALQHGREGTAMESKRAINVEEKDVDFKIEDANCLVKPAAKASVSLEKPVAVGGKLRAVKVVEKKEKKTESVNPKQVPHPSRTSHQGHPGNLPAVSVSGTNYIASSPSPPQHPSDDTSVFREARRPSPWN